MILWKKSLKQLTIISIIAASITMAAPIMAVRVAAPEVTEEESKQLTFNLCWAIRDQNQPEVTRLLDLGANANKPDENGLFPLEIAAVRPNLQIVELLLNYYALINQGTQSPILKATAVGTVAVMHLLLQKNADPNLHNPLELAAKKKNIAKIKLLLDYNANPHASAENSEQTLYQTYPLLKQIVDERAAAENK
jgi:ankyrin repeat protein